MSNQSDLRDALESVRAILVKGAKRGAVLRLALPSGEGVDLPSHVVEAIARAVEALRKAEGTDVRVSSGLRMSGDSGETMRAMEELVALSEELGLYEITEIPDPSVFRFGEIPDGP